MVFQLIHINFDADSFRINNGQDINLYFSLSFSLFFLSPVMYFLKT